MHSMRGRNLGGEDGVGMDEEGIMVRLYRFFDVAS